jgi:hypothetical protein
LNLINHKDIRFADCVIKLDLNGASSYRRLRAETFVLEAMTPWDFSTAFDVVRIALGSFPDHLVVDFLLGEQLSTSRTSSKKFGIGWKIFEQEDSVEILFNDLFAKHETTLSVERSVLTEAGDVLLKSVGNLGKLYYTIPRRDFRYAVYCQLDGLKCSTDIVRQTQVSFSVSLPKFMNPGDSLKSSEIKKETQEIIPSSIDSVFELVFADASQSSNRMPSVSVEANFDPTKHLDTRIEPEMSSLKLVELKETPAAMVFAFEEPETVEQNRLSAMQSRTSLAGTLSANDEETYDKLSFAAEPSVYVDKQTDEVFINMQLNAVVDSKAVDDIRIILESSFDVTLCVLLDDKVETAIASAAFLSEIVSRDTRVIEIGLWRRRFKSVFQRFVPVTEVFELTSLNFPRQVGGDLSRFLSNIAVESHESTPVVVMGKELFNSTAFNELRKIFDDSFNKARLVVFSQGNLDLLSTFPDLSALIDWSTESIFVLTNQGADLIGTPELTESSTVHIYITPYIKQQLLTAEQKGVFNQKLRELERQILLR